MYLKGRIIEAEMQRDIEFPLLLHSPNGCVGSKSTTLNCICVSHMGAGAQVVGIPSIAFPGALAETWIEMKQGELELVSMSNVGICNWQLHPQCHSPAPMKSFYVFMDYLFIGYFSRVVFAEVINQLLFGLKSIYFYFRLK